MEKGPHLVKERTEEILPSQYCSPSPAHTTGLTCMQDPCLVIELLVLEINQARIGKNIL